MAASTQAACLGNVAAKFNTYTKNPAEFLSLHDGSQYVDLTKDLYDVQGRESHKELSSLVIESFDDEQVWQQLELRNGAMLKESLAAVSRLVTLRSSPSLELDLSSHQCPPEASRERTVSPELQADSEDDSSQDEPREPKELAPSDPSDRKTDGKPVTLSDVNAFLDGEAVDQFEDTDDDDVDYFGDLPSDEDAGQSGRDAKYEDFFDPPGTNTALECEGNAAECEYDEEDMKEQPKSSFEIVQQRVKKKMEHLEEENLSEKPWNLQGEVGARGRPRNSLLQEHLQFDHMTRQAPTITEETTKQLEKIILDRIRDKAWDDVERKHKPVEEPFEFRRRVTLDQEKSKLSLAQVYEQQFLKQGVQEEKEDPLHEEIKSLMSSLFTKLDALSNFHLLPKQVAPELKIVNHLPSVTVEEVTPVGMSDAQLLAPEEIKEKPRKEVVEEKSKSRRLRERRIKRAHRKEKQERQLKGSSKEETTRKLLKGPSTKLLKVDDKNVVSSSKKFFEALQQKSTKKTTEKPTKKKKVSTEAVALKL